MSSSSWFHGIKGKLLLTTALPIAGFVVSVWVSMNGLGQVQKYLHSASDEIIPNLGNLAVLRQARHKFGYMIYAVQSDLDNKRDSSKDLAEAKLALDEYKENLADYKKTPFMPEEAEKFKAIEVKFTQVLSMMEEIYSLAASGNLEKATKAQVLLEGEYHQVSAAAGGYAREMMQNYVKRSEKETLVANDVEKNVRFWALASAGICITLVTGILLYIASQISNAVSSVASRLTEASDQVASSVDQLSEAGNSLSQSSTEAAASLEETVASLEELTSMVRMNSDNAKQAASLSASSREAAELGQREIETLIGSMNKISQSSKKIEEIISVIDDIAFQTNLLALNASVEAARAGEQGKGFAVVAEAVRALAQRSAAAAKDINHLIKESVQEVEDGGRIANQSGVVLNNIVTSVKKVSDLNNEIATASSEQTAGIQQISKAMNQLDGASQSNAASAEEIAATSGEINNLAATTQSLTVTLNDVIHGPGRSGHVSPSAPAKAPEKTTSTSPAEKFKTSSATNVVKFKASVKPSKPASAAQDVIPFDDEPRAKVGTTDGF